MLLAFGFTVEALKWAVFSAIMIVLVFTDLHQSLPDVVNYTGIRAGVALSSSSNLRGAALWLANLRRLPSPAPILSFADAISARRSEAAFCGWSRKPISDCGGEKAWASATSK